MSTGPAARGSRHSSTPRAGRARGAAEPRRADGARVRGRATDTLAASSRLVGVTALYRTYRPQDFDDVVGQEAVVRTLRNAIELDQVRQAYLFAGPRGTGKTSMARILAKCLNCAAGPTATPDKTCHACVAIANGTSLDVIEMDAASQRGIDDIREIRDRVILQPAEGRYKVYILDEAHQLTDAAWNALLKLIEEPPPHLVFVFCTTDLAKVLPTVRSRCQTFVFARPRLPELVRVLRRIADAETIEVPDAALALIARGARGSFRDAVSTLDQLASATGNAIDVQSVLQLLGAVEEDALFRLCDAIVDRDTAGALVFLEELAEQGQDLGRLVTDLLEHLRHLLLVQHMGHVPDSLPVTDETRERLREQANQLPAATVLRLCDLLAVAVEDSRQGADPRLPLELALVKVTKPGSDLSRESLAFRVDQLEQRLGGTQAVGVPIDVPEQPTPIAPQPTAEAPPAPAEAPPLALTQLQEAWPRTVLPAVQSRSIPVASLLGEARPAALADETLTLEFPASADFHRRQAEEPKNVGVIRDALYEVTGHRLAVTLSLGEHEEPAEDEDDELSEDALISMFKDTFDAQEVEEPR
jgi:DNA polymerase-3 subunit gamma/tau